MKKFLLFAGILAGAILLSCDLNADNKSVSNKAALETQAGRHGYVIGRDMGKAIMRVDVELNNEMLIQGIRDQLDSTRLPLMNDSELAANWDDLVKTTYKIRTEKDSIAREEIRQKFAENLVIQNAFLEKNKGETGVIITESGLQYTIVEQGSGKAAKDGDIITVHYTGSLLDGTEFDSSIKRNQPLIIALAEGSLIKGWVEILRLMKKGTKVRAWIPSSLGYGPDGNPAIPGNSLLIFDMELLNIEPEKK
jgi:FKBP-type peptidyl-prolyl cis-trans isomerase